MNKEESQRTRRAKPLPVFRSGRTRTMDEMDAALVDEIATRAARR